jgi:hypothetical protein
MCAVLGRRGIRSRLIARVVEVVVGREEADCHELAPERYHQGACTRWRGTLSAWASDPAVASHHRHHATHVATLGSAAARRTSSWGAPASIRGTHPWAASSGSIRRAGPCVAISPFWTCREIAWRETPTNRA